MSELLWVFTALSASIMWGLAYVMDKKVLNALSVTELLFMTHSLSLIAVLIMFAVQSFYGQASLGAFVVKLSHPENLKWILLTVLVAFVANFMIIKSIQLSNATLAALVEVSYPFFTVLFSILILKDNTITLDVVIGGCLIIAGVLWISLRT